MRTLLITFFVTLLSASCYSETIKLKNGKTVQAKIIEKTDNYIKIDLYGIPIKYYTEDIETIDRAVLSRKKAETGIDIEHIRKQLKELNYPEHS